MTLLASHMLGPMRADGRLPDVAHAQGRHPRSGHRGAFPVPVHAACVADLPTGWRRFSTAEKIEHLLGMSLTRAAEMLMWPPDEFDEMQASLRWQVWRVVFMFGVKAMLAGEFDRERERRPRLEQLARKLGAAPEA